jgi:hypothetical protein
LQINAEVLLEKIVSFKYFLLMNMFFKNLNFELNTNNSSDTCFENYCDFILKNIKPLVRYDIEVVHNCNIHNNHDVIIAEGGFRINDINSIEFMFEHYRDLKKILLETDLDEVEIVRVCFYR